MYDNSAKVTKSIADAAMKVMMGESQQPEVLSEELKGDQHKIDKNKNKKIDAEDFKILRGEKKMQEERDSCEDEAEEAVDKHEKKMHGKKGEVSKHEKEMHSEEVEQIDEVNVKQIKKDLDSGMSHDAVIGKHANKRTTNTNEIRKVIQQHAWDKRMKKEEVEQIDELSKKTLGSYAKKAAYDTVTKAIDYGSNMDQSGSQHKELGKINKREKGVQKAIDRLAKEEFEIEEGTKVQVAPGRTRNVGTHGRAQGSAFGGTDWDKEESEKEEKPKTRRKYGARQNYTRSTRVNESFTDMLEMYNEGGVRALLESLQNKEIEIEEEATNDEFKAELDKAQAKSEGREKANVAQPLVTASKRVDEEVEQIEERELTSAETAKKEKYVKSMKKGLQGFKDRYGDRAKEVMYATATKMAKEEVEQLDEISTKTLAGAAHAASDPEAQVRYGDKDHDPQKFADYAKRKKDAKSAAAVQGAADAKGHYPRPGHKYGYDKLLARTPSRTTSTGKANKQDVNSLKSKIKRGY